MNKKSQYAVGAYIPNSSFVRNTWYIYERVSDFLAKCIAGQFRTVTSLFCNDRKRGHAVIGRSLQSLIVRPILMVILWVLLTAIGNPLFEVNASAQTPDHGPVVSGVFQGSASASPSGQATYNIPLQLPPGIQGIQPNISFNYSSANGRGTAGVGWNLKAGQQAITRCSKTVSQGELNEGVNYTDSDRFCLNGQRLVLKSGVYGAPASTYRTEVESHMEVIANSGTLQNGPNSFTVTNRDGVKYEFGNTVDSRVEVVGSSGVVRYWALNRVIDLNDNYMDYSYVEVTTAAEREHYLKNIKYTGNAPLTPKYTVDIEYENLIGDQRTYYQAGYLVKQTKRIKTVNVSLTTGSALIRSYHLDYEASETGTNSHNRLQYITHCSKNQGATECLKPLRVSWVDGVNGWEPDVTDLPSDVSGERFLVGDWDGDGRSDLFIADEPSTGSNPLEWKLALGKDDLDVTPTALGIPAHETSAAETWESLYYTIDYNGDGRDDILQVRYGQNSGNWLIYESTGNSASPILNADGLDTGISINVPINADRLEVLVADYDGDGLDDILAIDFGKLVGIRNNNGTGFHPKTTLNQNITVPNPFDNGSPIAAAFNSLCCTADLNNDQIPDLRVRLSLVHAYQCGDQGICQKRAFPWVYLVSNGTNYELYFHLPHDLRRDWEALLDINGDGLDDLSHFIDGTGHAIAINTGTGFENEFAAIPRPPGTIESSHVVDYNNDGRMDRVLKMTSGAHYLMESNGTSFLPHVHLGTAGTNLTFADINGDGNLDIVEEVPGAADDSPMTIPAPSELCDPGDSGCESTYIIPVVTLPSANAILGRKFNQNNLADIVDYVIDGYGNFADFTFQPLATSSSYVQDFSASTSPSIKPYWGGTHVVTSLEMNDGIIDGMGDQSSYFIDYEYRNAVYEGSGRGFQGFQFVKSTDSRNGVYNEVTFEQAFPRTGRIQSSSIYQSDSKPIEKIENIWKDENLGGQPQRKFLYLDKVKQFSYDVSSAASGTNGNSLRRMETDYDFESFQYGQLDKVTTEIFATDVSVTPVHTSTVDYTPVVYDPNGSFPYCLSLMDDITITNSQTSGMPSDRKTTLDPDQSMCRYKGQTDYSSSSLSEQSVLSYAYDSFGNRASTAHNAAPMAVFENDVVFSQRRFDLIYGADGHNPIELVQCVGDGLNGSCAPDDSNNPSSTLGWSDSLGQLESNQILTSASTVEKVDRIFDGFGRLKSIDRPEIVGGLLETFVYLDCSNSMADCWVADAVREVNAVSPNGQQTRILFDSLSRIVGTEQSTVTDLGMNPTVRVDVAYDSLGRVYERSNPYFSTSTAGYYTSYVYDVIGRVLEIQAPPVDDSSSVNRITKFTYSNQTIVRTDPELGKTERRFDDIGRLVEAIDELDHSISYEHDEWGSVTETTNSTDDSTITRTYDSRGRLESIDDPDRGLINYRYDPADALIWMQDENGVAATEATKIQYDELGRPTKRYDHGILSEFKYYDNRATGNGFGRLKSHQKNPGVGPKVVYEYDFLGRVTGEVTTLPNHIDFPAVAPSYRVDRTYNDFGQLELLTYPKTHNDDRLVLEHSYTNGILTGIDRIDDPSNIESYYTLNAMSVWGNVNKTTYGNTVVNTQDYGLSSPRLDSSSSALGGAPFRNYSFKWDKVGNLVERSRMDSGISLTEGFSYDDNYRLESAEVGVCTNLACKLDVEYHPNGNIKMKSNVADVYQYDQAASMGGPHALSGIAMNGANGAETFASYQYDANGNMTSRDGSSIHWTSFNKPYEINNGLSKSRLFYDANYSRYRQVETHNSSSAETLYIGGLLERHVSVFSASSVPVIGYRQSIYANGQRIATLSDIQSTASSDGDSIVDANDNCALISNQAQIDSDEDGIGNACDPDLNNDGIVNFLDVAIFNSSFLLLPPDPNYNPDADLNGDGNVNFLDFSVFDDYFLGPPGPARSTVLGKRIGYFHTDHLGSIDAITDETGILVAEFNYDAFGQSRNPTTWEYDEDSLADDIAWSTTTRGFTDHEQLRSVALVHMNGRVYDPLLGRMISADPFIPDPYHTQHYNRYSYVVNNPLKYTDPTGFQPLEDLDAHIVPDATTPGVSPPPGLYGPSLAGPSDDGLRPASGGTAGLRTEEPQPLNRERAELSGSATPKEVQFQILLNPKGVIGSKKSPPTSGGLYGQLNAEGVPTGFRTVLEAVQAGLRAAADLSGTYEYGGGIIEKDGSFFFTNPATTRQTHKFSASIDISDGTLVALYHTHPGIGSGARKFSPHDIDVSNALELPSYIGLLKHDRAIRLQGFPARRKVRFDRFGNVTNNEGRLICRRCF